MSVSINLTLILDQNDLINVSKTKFQLKEEGKDQCEKIILVNTDVKNGRDGSITNQQVANLPCSANTHTRIGSYSLPSQKPFVYDMICQVVIERDDLKLPAKFYMKFEYTDNSSKCMMFDIPK